jgi:hypothetical protein
MLVAVASLACCDVGLGVNYARSSLEDDYGISPAEPEANTLKMQLNAMNKELVQCQQRKYCPCGKWQCFVSLLSIDSARKLIPVENGYCIDLEGGICPPGSLPCTEKSVERDEQTLWQAENEIEKNTELTKQEDAERTIFLFGMDLRIDFVAWCLIACTVITFLLQQTAEKFKEWAEAQWHHQRIFEIAVEEFALLGLLSFSVVLLLVIEKSRQCCNVTAVVHPRFGSSAQITAHSFTNLLRPAA